jgi:hypothetical protein
MIARDRTRLIDRLNYHPARPRAGGVTLSSFLFALAFRAISIRWPQGRRDFLDVFVLKIYSLSRKSTIYLK